MNTDRVQGRIETFIEKLKGGIVEGLINQEETKTILKKRNDFEYSIERNQVTLEDYQHYIKFELQLERLRKKRRERLDTPSTHNDYIFIENIVRLYKAVAQKFRNIEMIREQIEFCKANKLEGALGESYQNAIAFFPRKEEFWLGAAQSKKGFNLKRNIYQKAIRLNPESRLLWLAFCKSELNFAVSLIRGKEREKNDSSLQKIAFTVYKQAIKSENLSKDSQFKVQFLQLFEEYTKKMNVGDSIKKIQEEISHDPSNDLKVLNVLPFQTDKIDLLERAIQTSQDKPNAYRQFVEYYLTRTTNEKEATESSERILKLFEEIEQKEEWNPQLSIQFVDFLIGLGKTEKAIQALERSSESYPSSIEFWKYKTSIHARLLALLSGNAVSLIPKSTKTSAEVWFQILEYSIIIGLPFETILENFKRVVPIISKNLKDQNALVHLADMIHIKFGGNAFRSICESIGSSIPFSMLMRWIVFERQQVSPSKQTIRKLFDKACSSEWGKTSDDLWSDYWQFENEANEMQSGNIYWRAKRSLLNPTKFIQRVTLANQAS